MPIRLKSKNIFLILVVLGFFASIFIGNVGLASTVDIENFDSYPVGDLSDNGNWVGSNTCYNRLTKRKILVKKYSGHAISAPNYIGLQFLDSAGTTATGFGCSYYENKDVLLLNPDEIIFTYNVKINDIVEGRFEIALFGAYDELIANISKIPQQEILALYTPREGISESMHAGSIRITPLSDYTSNNEYFKLIIVLNQKDKTVSVKINDSAAVSAPYLAYSNYERFRLTIHDRSTPIAFDDISVEYKSASENDEPRYSSVLFLPGLQASRLYANNYGEEDQLWEPTNHNDDVRQLYLYPMGSSVNNNIYTKDIVDEVYGFGDNIYKSFIESMDDLVADEVIEEWKPIPYDWRLPLEEIVYGGIKLENDKYMDIIEEVKRMASNSGTGRVTIIGHSNGGFLAKVLIDRLKESSEEGLIDKLIMVGTPQLGTPKAMAALLHGDETELLQGIILDKKVGRGFAENMAGAYNLLPSKEYFNIVQSPVAEFDEDVKEIYDFRNIYGENIDNFDEFNKFLLGDYGARSKPDFNDLDSPNVLWAGLLEKAKTMHSKLDSWQAPEGMEVIQIAGWGLDTIRGIKYDDCDIPFCPDNLNNLDRSLILTQDGDETVVVPSAVAMDGVERYYVDIKGYNDNERIVKNTRHASILEIESLQDFIKNVIQNNKELTNYISTEKPIVKDEDKRLRFRLHSPLSIDLYDDYGNHTGLIENTHPDSDLRFYEEQIPNSYYIEFGETKYLGSSADSPINIELTGEDIGTFTFEIDEVAGDKVAKTTVFADIPTVKNMKVNLSISDSVSEMAIDIDNDGQMDIAFQPGEEIKKEDQLEIFIKIVDYLEINNSVKNKLINKIENAKKQIEKGHIVSANAMLENVKQQIGIFSREQTPEKLRIPTDEAKNIIGIINKIIIK